VVQIAYANMLNDIQGKLSEFFPGIEFTTQGKD
jgi:hypothetical protein